MTKSDIQNQFENAYPEYLTVSEFLACLDFVKQAMLRGDASVEGYYFAKELLFSRLEMPSEAIN